jgi:hypothetical protein
MEALFSSKTSVEFHPTTWRYIAEDKTFHGHGCESLKLDSNFFHNNLILRNAVNGFLNSQDISGELPLPPSIL